MEAPEDLSDDPVALLNLQPEGPAEGRAGSWWLASIFSFVGCIGLSVLVLFSLPRQNSDLFGAIITIGIGVLAGTLLCVGCAVVSFARNEKNRYFSLFLALPSMALLVWALFALLKSKLHLH